MNSYQRSKVPLALMEQIIMILVFAAASAVCIQAFVYSNQLSKKNLMRQHAMERAQQMAEYCKAYEGDLETLNTLLNGTMIGSGQTTGLRVSYPDDDLVVRVELTVEAVYLQKATVTVNSNTDGEEIYSMDIAYQKGGSH